MSKEFEERDAANYAAIVLAAGLSERMGSTNKLLLEFEGQSLLRQCVTSIKDAGVGEIIVVLGHESDNTAEQLVDLDVRWVTNAEYESGQMSSVQCGLNTLSGEKKATFICLADQPLLKAIHLRTLMLEFECLSDGKQIVVPVFENERGNPVVLGEVVRKQVLHQGRHSGCRRFIDAHPELVNWVIVNDEAFVRDIDTPEEYVELSSFQ